MCRPVDNTSFMKRCAIIFIAVIFCANLYAQDSKQQLINSSALDTTRKGPPVVLLDTTAPKIDSAHIHHHDPKKATMRALMFPGLGQIYNRQYWKVPLAYAAVGIPVAFFFYNNTWYKRTKLAYEIVATNQTSRYNEIYEGLIYKDTGLPLDANSLRSYRNQFRRDRDYSVLYFLLGYALTIVDATVSGHLKEFDISEDLSMNIQPTILMETKTPGISMAINFKSASAKKLKSW